ncbi:hypothetical protein ACFOYW_03815 [Gryllotalpicola reticulitermitis]|uniref:Uncharacterized protein n=1 Tax=Gryllotalpicola reticulitermitis TaxID=1184153 RepID=A0ABV8Q2C5_9MICO
MSLVAEASKYWSRAVGLAPARIDVEVVRVGDDGWRVSLPDPEQSPFSLLGFITLAGGRYRVCSTEHPCSETETETLAEAIDALRPIADTRGLLVA